MRDTYVPSAARRFVFVATARRFVVAPLRGLVFTSHDLTCRAFLCYLSNDLVCLHRYRLHNRGHSLHCWLHDLGRTLHRRSRYPHRWSRYLNWSLNGLHGLLHRWSRYPHRRSRYLHRLLHRRYGLLHWLIHRLLHRLLHGREHGLLIGLHRLFQWFQGLYGLLEGLLLQGVRGCVNWGANRNILVLLTLLLHRVFFFAFPHHRCFKLINNNLKPPS